MRPRTLRAMPLFPLLAAVLVACFGSSPKMTFHTLGVDVTAAPRAVSRFKSLGVGPITLPALLEQSGVVLRKDNYTVELSSTHEWGGKLADELLRALTRYLQLRLPGVQVISVPWETAQAPQIQLALSLDRFDGSPGGQAVLMGTWILQNPEDGRSIAVNQVSLKEKVEGDSVHALVEAQAKLVVRLGERVVRGLR